MNRPEKTLFSIAALLLLAAGLLCPPAFAQWDPYNGEWGKEDSGYLRVMTWNVKDGICSTNTKQEGYNNWTGLVVIVAALKPDVLIIQEAGDNDGNGTGYNSDSVSTLLTVFNLVLNGGYDPYNGNIPVTAYVQKYAPGYSLPYIFVSSETDGYNRNVIASRYPFLDLNGDTKSQLSDMPYVNSDQWAPGGDGGIRGFQLAEINLPDGEYLKNLVIGNSHLKAGSSSSDKADRLEAAQNSAYLVEYWFNGAGTGSPDPNNKINDYPPATSILDPDTPFIWGGDWNEDEFSNGRDGPALWMVRAQSTQNDGTDRDRTDALYDTALEPISGQRGTFGSNSKYDYLAHQDSIAAEQLSFIFYSGNLSSGQIPAEVQNFPTPSQASSTASDHRPVIADYELPRVSTSFTLSVSPTPLMAGQNGTFELVGGQPNTAAYLIYSLSGIGSTWVPQLNVTLGIRNPVLGRSGTTDSQGAIDWIVPIPSAGAGRNIWFQAAQQGEASNVVGTSMQ